MPIQPIAIVIAFFFAYLVPTAVLFTLGGIGVAKSETGTYSAHWLSVLLVGSWVMCPIAGGYLASRLAKQRPYVHALIVSIAAGIALGLMDETFSIKATLTWIAGFSCGGITGAWMYQRIASRAAAKR